LEIPALRQDFVTAFRAGSQWDYSAALRRWIADETDFLLDDERATLFFYFVVVSSFGLPISRNTLRDNILGCKKRDKNT